MAKTSIHIEPCKTAVSEQHNTRAKELDYVRPELSSQNAQLISESIADAFRRIQTTYKENVGQKMQAKATPIKEGVIVLDPNESNEVLMGRLQDFSNKIQEKFGIKTIQTYIHRDEGHIDNDGVWKINCHAHMVFDWTDDKGKSLKLKPKIDFPLMQTLLADSLHMDRGESSDVKHLSSIQYKMREEQKRLVELAQTVREKSSQSVQLSQEIIKSTNELKEVKGEKDIVNADVQELAQNRVILDAAVNTLKEQKEILSKEVDPKKKSFLARVELAASNLAEKGLSALSASEKDTLITSLTMRLNEADAQVSALIKQMPYAESKEIAKLNIKVSELEKDLKDKTSSHDAYLEKTRKDIKELNSTINTMKDENSLLKSLLPSLHQNLLKAGFVVKQVAELVAGKVSSLLKGQKISFRDDSYTAHGGEKARLQSYKLEDGSSRNSLEIDGKSFHQACMTQAELNKQKLSDHSVDNEHKKGKGI